MRSVILPYVVDEVFSRLRENLAKSGFIVYEADQRRGTICAYLEGNTGFRELRILKVEIVRSSKVESKVRFSIASNHNAGGDAGKDDGGAEQHNRSHYCEVMEQNLVGMISKI